MYWVSKYWLVKAEETQGISRKRINNGASYYGDHEGFDGANDTPDGNTYTMLRSHD